MQLIVSEARVALVFSSALCMSISNSGGRTETIIGLSTSPEAFDSQVSHLGQSSSLLYYHGHRQ